MAGILIATGFVRIDADTSPAMKAIKGLGAIGASALSTTILPVTAAVAAGVGAMTATLASAGAAGGAFAAAVVPQFQKITEAGEKLNSAEEAQEKAAIAKAHAQKLAKAMGVEYGQQIEITSDMTEDAKTKAQEYNRALSQVTTANETARKSQAIYNEKMAAMTPATRQTAKSFEGLKDDIDKWSDSLSGTTMPLFTAGIEKLRALLPRLTPFVRIAAREIKQFTSSFGEGQAGKVFDAFGRNLQANAGSALGNLLTSIRNITVGVVGMINAFMPVQSDMSGGLVELTQRFADFGAGLSESEGFATFMERATGAVPAMRDIGAAIADIVSAAGPLSGIGLRVLQVFAQLIAATPEPVLKAIIPAILAVNLGLKVYAVYQAAAAAATWLFSTAVTTSTGVTYANRIALVSSYVVMGIFKAAMIASAIATGLYTAATTVATAVTTALGVAIAFVTSPIGLVIVAVGLLVAAIVVLWKKNETFRSIVTATWNGIKDAALAVGRWFAGPFVDFFRAAWDLVYTWYIRPIIWYWTEAVPNAAKFLWSLVVRYFNLMLSGVQAAWGLYQRLIIRPFLWFYTEAIPGAARYLWNQVVRFFNLLGSGVSAAYGLIRARVFTPLGNFFTVTIPGWASSLRTRVVAAWNGLLAGLSGIYTGVRNRVFSPIGTFFTKTIPGWALTLRDKVKGYFAQMRDGIGTIWSGIQSKTKTPVNWVLQNIWNKGLVSIWGKIAGWIGLDNKLKTVKLLESGGTVGNGPIGVFNRPTAIVGEGNPSYPEFVIPTDPKYATRARGLWQAAGAHFMEDGGILGTIKGAIGSAAGKVTDLGKAAMGFLEDPAGQAKKLLMAPLANIARSIGSSQWARMVARFPRMAVDGLLKAVKSVGSDLLGAVGLGSSGDPGGGSGVERWRGVVQTVLKMVGQPAALTNTTLRRMNQESGGNPKAVNLWDINAKNGTPSVGLMQVIRPTFQAYAGKYRNTGPFMYGVSIAPVPNIYSSMKYALSTYGSLARAYNRPGGYRNGTAGTAGGLHLFGEAGPELGFSPSGWRVLNARQTAPLLGGAGTTVVHLTVENHGVIGSRQETEDWLTETLDQLRRKNRLPRSLGGTA
ncbi:transglycosylase SLT domain-containing protein [Streptomyces sp. NPDC017936]|uniref:transglycosylase SLT domain-containing protein n=1 Tax=Streptomyces sp. NPDC017936 TaxID=3365016 RepID=UPI0037AFDE77